MKENILRDAYGNPTFCYHSDYDFLCDKQNYISENGRYYLLVESTDLRTCMDGALVKKRIKKVEYMESLDLVKEKLHISEKEETTMTTLSYVLASGREIEEGEHYFFGQLWDGEGNADELLESGVIYVDEVARVEFTVVEYGNDALDTVVVVKEIDLEEEEEDDR